MAANDKKMSFRIYTIMDYEKEEKFLREQHKKGYKLVKWTFPGFYHFEKCEPQDMVYRLEYSAVKDSDKSDYIQMYKDFGWEYMFDAVGWSYFRKCAEKTEGNEEIFSDKLSKIEHLYKVFRHRMIPGIVVFLCCVVPNVTKIVNGGTWSMANIVFNVFWIVMFILYVVTLTICMGKFTALKRKYSEA